MKSMKSLLLAVLLIVAVVVSGCGNSNTSTNSKGTPAPAANTGGSPETPTGKQMTVKIAHSSAPGSARDLGAHEFKKVIEAETNGLVKIEIFPASQLGSPTEQVQAVQLGNIEMTIVPTSFMGGFQPLITLLDIPFLFPNNKEELLELQQSEAMRALLDTTDAVGIKSLGIWHTGFKQFTGPKPLNTPEAFQGLKFRAMPSPVIFEQFKILGASPTNLAFSETYNALATGTINAQENPIDTTYDMKLHEVQQYFTMTDHGVLDQLIIINKAFYDQLDQGIKDAMQKAFEAGREVTVAATYEAIEKYTQTIKDSGVEFVEITDAERQVFIDKTQAVRDFYVTEYGEEGKKLLEAIETAK